MIFFTFFQRWTSILLKILCVSDLNYFEIFLQKLLISKKYKEQNYISMSSLNEEETQFPSELQKDETTQTLNKIANFLEMKNIFINQFWQSNRNYASAMDLEKFCQSCGLKLGIHDQINLKNELFVGREAISIYQFCDLIPQWKSKGSQMISQFLKERSQQLVQNLNAKHKNQRVKSSSGSNMRNSNSAVTFQIQKDRLHSASKESTKPYKPNNSRKYLQQNRIKNIRRQQQLADTIQKTKNEHQYSMLIKMNELNEYHHKNKSTTTYRAFKNAEGIIKVRVFQLQSFKKELSIQQFESQYKIYKKSTKQNKNWQRPKSTKLSTPVDFMCKTTQNSSGHGLGLITSKNNKKEERQQQLRNLLVNTVNLTKQLEQQIKIFKMKGIHGCQAI